MFNFELSNKPKQLEIMNELQKFEKETYLQEKEEFMADKCSCCMNYLNEDNECENNFCESKIPIEYR